MGQNSYSLILKNRRVNFKLVNADNCYFLVVCKLYERHNAGLCFSLKPSYFVIFADILALSN